MQGPRKGGMQKPSWGGKEGLKDISEGRGRDSRSEGLSEGWEGRMRKEGGT